MSNMQIINKLKDYAELAWASYGYFYLADKGYKSTNNKDDERLKYFRNTIKQVEYDIRPTFADILNIEYKYYKVGTLKGDFTPTQAKRFFERYTLIGHIPDDKNRHISYDKRGFSATIFYDNINTDYIIAFSGTKY